MAKKKKKTNTGSDHRSLKLMRSRGYHCDNVNEYVLRRGPSVGKKARFGYRRDAFAFMDLLAFKAGEAGSTAVQCTTKKQISSHLRKYRRDPETRQRIIDWILAGNTLIIQGWSVIQVATTSKNAKTPFVNRWTCDEHFVSLEDMELKPSDTKSEKE